MENESGYEAGSEKSPLTSDTSLSDSTIRSKKRKKKPCEICGSVSNELLIMTCFRCRETREHTYCARVILRRVPHIWLCEECRSSSSIVHILADKTANSRTSQVDNKEDSIVQTARSSRTNQVGHEDSIEAPAAPLSRTNNQAVENEISLTVDVPHVHMYTTSEESSPGERFSEDIRSIVFKSMWERFNPPQIIDLSSDSESEE